MDDLLSVPDTAYLARVTFRLAAAAVLGGLIGAEREYVGKAAGLRTHMTVALGSAAFVLIAIEGGTDNANLSRAIQGIAAGIGYNYLVHTLRVLTVELDNFAQELTSRMEIEYLLENEFENA